MLPTATLDYRTTPARYTTHHAPHTYAPTGAALYPSPYPTHRRVPTPVPTHTAHAPTALPLHPTACTTFTPPTTYPTLLPAYYTLSVCRRFAYANNYSLCCCSLFRSPFLPATFSAYAVYLRVSHAARITLHTYRLRLQLPYRALAVATPMALLIPVAAARGLHLLPLACSRLDNTTDACHRHDVRAAHRHSRVIPLFCCSCLPPF